MRVRRTADFRCERQGTEEGVAGGEESSEGQAEHAPICKPVLRHLHFPLGTRLISAPLHASKLFPLLCSGPRDCSTRSCALCLPPADLPPAV